jgi:hypothetical protein
MEVDIPLTWTGTRPGGEGPSSTFTQNDSWHGFATDLGDQNALPELGEEAAAEKRRIACGRCCTSRRAASIVQVQGETVPALVALDEEGRATVAFAKAEPLDATTGQYETEVSASTGGDFAAPTVLVEGLPFAMRSDSGGLLLAVKGIATGVAGSPTLHFERFDAARGWRALPDYACKAATCDVQFGSVGAGEDVLIVERTFLSISAFLVHPNGMRDETLIAAQEPSVGVLSHALSITPDGEALSLWLTQNGMGSARFNPENGWSAARSIYARVVETESRWLSNETQSQPASPNQYPMQLQPLGDGVFLSVWAEYDSLRTTSHDDFFTRDAAAQSLWVLVTDGITATAEHAF